MWRLYLVLVALGSYVTIAAEGVGDEVSNELLLSYAQQIHSCVGSIYQSSSIELVSVDPNKSLNGRGTLRFWGEGMNYRYESRMLHSNGEVDCDITYDGNQYSWFSPKYRVMHVSTNDQKALMTSLNPLFLPCAFFSPRSASCEGCQLKLSDFMDVSSLRERIDLLSSTEDEVFVRLLMSGDVVDGKRFVWRVVFDKTKPLIPTLIRRETLDGEVIDDLVFPKVDVIDVEGKRTFWPKTVEYTGFDQETGQRFKLVYKVDERIVGGAVIAETFLPDTNAARIILDGDVDGRVIKKEQVQTDHKSPRFIILAALFLISSVFPVGLILWKRTVIRHS